MEKMTHDEIKRLYGLMLLIRRFDEEAIRLYSKGKLVGSVHPYVGEEAIAAGIGKFIRQDDYFVSTHRGHGHAIAKGVPVDRMMAELMGKATGCCHGKGGSMHIADIKRGLAGSNGIVGAGMPIAVGLGLAAQVKKTDQVAVCFFGDGASNEGTFHESLNLASVWHLPVIFVCENNLYAVSVSKKKHSVVENIADRAIGYGIPGVVVDGMDVMSVMDAAEEAVRRARNGEGPTLIEAKTFRYLGHSRGDPPYGTYRTKEEVDEWKKRDCLQKLAKDGELTPEEISEIEQHVKEILRAAVEFADNSPLPEISTALTDVYA